MKRISPLLLSLSLLLCGCTSGSTAVRTAQPSVSSETEQIETDEATLFMVGDALMHEQVSYGGQMADGSWDFSGELSRIWQIAEPYDLQYYNQETILGGDDLGIRGYPAFNGPQAFGIDMADHGFNLVSLANNHCLDQGEQGIINSVNFWNSRPDVVTSGTYLCQEDKDAVRVYSVNNITYTFFSYTYGTNGIERPQSYLVADYNADGWDRMLDQIRRADSRCDVVIAAMHWGTEYLTEANEEQEELARQMAEAGADIIIGNHPHVIEPIQRIGNTICFYALGNLISNHAIVDIRNQIGMDAALTIEKTVTDGDTSITFKDIRADLIYTDNSGSIPRVIPFEEVTDEIQPDHEALYQEYLPIITAMDDEVQIGGL
jgi:poly-gamma-glutamate synthesis protein (capsule biosynthesis protein)